MIDPSMGETLYLEIGVVEAAERVVLEGSARLFTPLAEARTVVAANARTPSVDFIASLVEDERFRPENGSALYKVLVN